MLSPIALRWNKCASVKVVGAADRPNRVLDHRLHRLARYTVCGCQPQCSLEYVLCKQKALNRVFLYTGRDKDADLGCNQREALFHNIFCCVFI